MSTRLLVLGAVRFMQPVHGYDVRRELVSWQLEKVANVKPGSIYSALRTLEADGDIEAVARESAGARPERTTYALTPQGESDFQVLLRTAWWGVEPAIEPLIPALAMLAEMPRAELIAAVESRVEQLRARERQNDFLIATVRDGATGVDGEIPDHAREIMLFLKARTRAELDYCTGLRQRLQAGAYRLAGEPGRPTYSPGHGASEHTH